MRSSVHVSLERSAQQATMILEGAVSGSDAEAASRMCMALPPSVSVLRIDARQVTELDELAAPVLRSLVRTWKNGREGHVDLRLDWRVLRSLSDHATPGTPGAVGAASERMVATFGAPEGLAALTAAFL
ncbi:MAG TPA: hypothetical protein VK636_20845 [Gemmatimonadaceae bacterium]|nr:hypothetical protein [Gemmatimonadaceae bacterium]